MFCREAVRRRQRGRHVAREQRAHVHERDGPDRDRAHLEAEQPVGEVVDGPLDLAVRELRADLQPGGAEADLELQTEGELVVVVAVLGELADHAEAGQPHRSELQEQ